MKNTWRIQNVSDAQIRVLPLNGEWVDLMPGEMTRPIASGASPHGYATIRFTTNPNLDEPSPTRIVYEE